MFLDRGYGFGFRRDDRRDDGYDRFRWYLFYVKLFFFLLKLIYVFYIYYWILM